MTPAQVDVAVMSIAAAADVASTGYALRVCSGCSEGGPIKSPAVSLAAHAVVTAGVAAGCSELRKQGHPRAAKVLRWVVFAAWSGMAVSNLHKAGGIR